MAETPITFTRGAPSLDILDLDGLRESAGVALSRDEAGVFLYGTAIGYPPLREWIAELHGVAPEQVIVTNGSMQADAFLFELEVHPGDEVIVEGPTYDRTLLSLSNRGAKIHQLPVEDDGLDVEALERLLSGGAKIKLAHIIPDFQNPAGVTLSLEKRKRLVELAAEHDFVLFEDSPYRLLSFDGEPLVSMLELDRADKVVHASSFTKTVCPGVRVGYLVGSVDEIGRIRKIATETYISPSMVSEAIVNEFCRSGRVWSSIETIKPALKTRMETLADGLERELPNAKLKRPGGGYFLWVDLPGTDVAALAEAASERGVQFVKGSDFMLEGGGSSLRMAFSAVGPELITEGVKRLGEAARSLS